MTRRYFHHTMSRRSCRFFSFVLFGYVFQYSCLSFGYCLGVWLHQTMGLLPIAFLRSLSVGVQLYIDDSPVTSYLGSSTQRGVRQAVFLTIVIKSLYFGYTMSRKKCDLHGDVQTSFEALGLICDRRKEAFLVPEGKFMKAVLLGLGILELLETQGSYVPRQVARFVGLMLYLGMSIVGVRLRLNALYFELCGMELQGHSLTRMRHSWWRQSPNTQKRARKEVLSAMVEDVQVLLLRLQENTVRRWRRVGRAPLVEVSVDSTLWQYGGTIRRVPKVGQTAWLDGRVVGDVQSVWGGSFGDYVGGADVAGLNTASAKFSIPLPSFLKSSRRGLHQTQAPKKGGEKRKEKKRKKKVDARG